MIKAHAVIEFGSLVIFKKLYIKIRQLYIKIRQLYHLSLYKQGPNLPRVTISLPHFPPKNVTSSYSAHKNVTFLSIFFFYVFFILRIPRHLLLHCHFAFLLLGFVFLFSPVRKKTWKTICWCYCSMLWKTSGGFWCLLRKFSFPSPSSAFLLHLKMQFLTRHLFICPTVFCVFSFCFFPLRFLCSLFGREGGQTH